MTEQELLEIKAEVQNSGIPVPSQQKIIDACGKQVMKKVIYKPKDAIYQRPYCPCCDEELYDGHFQIGFCNCGQSISVS